MVTVNERRILTVFDLAGAKAAGNMAALLARHTNMLDRDQASAQMAAALINAERLNAREKRLRARAENSDNDESSIAPGVKITFTKDGYDMALETAEDTGFPVNQFRINGNEEGNDTVLVELPEGAYKVDHTGACYFYGQVKTNEAGQVKFPGESSFWVAGLGVHVIEGLQAEERWLPTNHSWQ